MKLSKRIAAASGTPSDFQAALLDRIDELSTTATTDVSAAVDNPPDIQVDNPDDVRYFVALKNKVTDILSNEYGVDVQATLEPFCVRFEVFVPGTYDELCEYTLLYEDCEPNMADVSNDASTLADIIIGECNSDDPEYENDEWEDFSDEDEEEYI